MTKEKLNKAEIKKLVKAYEEMKKAENNFKQIRDSITSELQDGTFQAEDGKVVVSTYESTSTDYKAFFEKNPRIKRKAETFVKTTTKRAVNVNPARN